MSVSSSIRLNPLLKKVSRSFYLTVRVLPGAVRSQIGLAYLLARATDTIADTKLVPVKERIRALHSLRERILGKTHPPLDLADLADPVSTAIEEPPPSPELVLLRDIEEILTALTKLSVEDQERIRQVLSIITSGQELDLNRFADAGPDRIIALATQQELDDYTWRVAGCVGEFWTRMCRAHLFPTAAVDETQLLANGIRFGHGLQLVNILRDLPADLRQGRCYIPADHLSTHGFVPAQLLEPANEPRFRPLYNLFLQKTEAHLAAGWDYTNALPRNCVRVRLACAWPILIGVKTLARLRTRNVLDPDQRIKISRAEVRALIARSLVTYAWRPAWQRLFSRIAAS
jgi:farnesyl-diphosphate farnesyltransferase